MLRYLEIKIELLKMAEQMQENETLPSRQRLCKKLKTTNNTLFKAIQELVKDGIFVSINGSGTYRSGISVDIEIPAIGENWGLVAVDDSTKAYSLMINGIRDECKRFGVNLILCKSSYDEKKQEAFIKKLSEKNISGMIIIPVINFNWKDGLNMGALLQKVSVPFVFCSRGVGGIHVPMTQKNDFLGGYLQAEYLIRQGYKNIVFIAGENHRATIDRCQGFVSAMHQSNRPVDRSLMLLANKDVYQHAITVLSANKVIDGICCHSDKVAMQVYRACSDLGIKVGEDVAVIGFDDTDLCLTVEPNLSSVSFNSYNMGKNSAELLWKLTRGYPLSNYNIYFEQPEIVERDSSPKKIF